MWVWWYYTSTLKKLKFYRLHSESAVTSNRQLRCKKIQIPLHFCSRLRLFRTSLYTMTFVTIFSTSNSLKGHHLLTRCRFNLLHYPYYWPSAFLGVTNAHAYLTSGVTASVSQQQTGFCRNKPHWTIRLAANSFFWERLPWLSKSLKLHPKRAKYLSKTVWNKKLNILYGDLVRLQFNFTISRCSEALGRYFAGNRIDIISKRVSMLFYS